MKRFLPVNRNLLLREISFLRSTISVPASFSFQQIVKFSLTLIITLTSLIVYSQTPEYKKVVTERSAKIVNTLELNDPAKQDKVLNEIADQYIQLNLIHESDKNSVDEIKKKTSTAQEMSTALKIQQEKTSARLLALHEKFIDRLKEDLTEAQLEKVKDGMTYGVLPITYKAYLDMLTRLTDEQKSQIYSWLKEARELAMDEGSSEKKHAVFGKYKGRINNYLSRAGYDMKKEGEEWQKRIKERNADQKQSGQ